MSRQPWGIQTVAERLDHLASSVPDEVFLLTPPDESGSLPPTLTYGDFFEAAMRFANFLARLGIRKGDLVHLQMGNRPEFLISFFGAALLGAVVVPVNPASTIDDIAYVTSHAECSLSIIDSSSADRVLSTLDLSPEIRQVMVLGHPVSGTIDFSEYLDSPVINPHPRCAVSGDDLLGVFYTSGTACWPKGVMITNRNLMFSGEAVASYLRMTPEDRWLVTLPLFHINAFGYSTMSAIATGASISLAPNFDSTKWATQATDSSATMASLFASHCRQLLTATETHTTEPELRVLLFAQHLRADERQTLTRRFGSRTLQIYGMTETVAPVIGDPMFGEIDANTIGSDLLWANTMVADPTGQPVIPGVAGELLVAGSPGRTLMSGYFRRPEESATALRSGWLHTGDRMVLDEQGRYRFLGRAAEIIKPSVNNVSAPEIERVLIEHVSIYDAAVIGGRSASGDEVVIAFVQPHDGDDPTPEEILEWASLRLADYKIPQRVIILESLPRNAVGKVLKRDLQILAEH